MRKPLSKGQRFKVFQRDSFTCQYCGIKAPNAVLHVDHVYPVSKGGTNVPENLVTACYDCNTGKAAKILQPYIYEDCYRCSRTVDDRYYVPIIADKMDQPNIPICSECLDDLQTILESHNDMRENSTGYFAHG